MYICVEYGKYRANRIVLHNRFCCKFITKPIPRLNANLSIYTIELTLNPPNGISVGLKDDVRLFEWTVVMEGPEDSP